MPGYDRTGPEGQGPMTGRASGKCNPENNTEQKHRPGTGMGRGCGRGRVRLGRGNFGGGRGRG